MIFTRRNLLLFFIILAIPAGAVFAKAGYVLTLHGGVTFAHGFPLRLWGIHYGPDGTRCIVPFEEPGMFFPLLPLPWQYVLGFGINLLFSAAVFHLLSMEPGNDKIRRIIKNAAWYLVFALLCLIALNISVDCKHGIHGMLNLAMFLIYAGIFILSFFTLFRKGNPHAD